MPTNKNAQLRYRILDRCFSDRHRRYEIDDLVDAVNDALGDMYGTSVSLRQIREDMKYMRDRLTYDAPIKAYPFDGRKCYYAYEDPDFSIFKSELSEEDRNKLQSTLKMLSRYRGIPSNAWLEETISKLEYQFGIKANSAGVVEFEQNDQLTGLEFLSDLMDATIGQQPLRITYQSYKGVQWTSVFHPYYLKQYNNRWFLFGLEESETYGNRISNKALDRIVKFEETTDVEFIPNTEIDFKEYFRDIVGVTIPEEHTEPEKVILRFSAKRFPYVLSKPIHQSQQIENEEDCTLSLHLKPNKEFESQLFFFGPDVEIIHPQWLREQFADKIAENYRKYYSMQNGCTEE